MSLERWHHRAAIVVWPRSHQFKVWNHAGTDTAIEGLAQMIAKLQKAKKAEREEKLEQCRQFASQIVESWQPGRSSSNLEMGEGTKKREFIFESLNETSRVKL